MKENIISCDLHDYIEIACLFEIEVKLVTRQGDIYIGTLITTRINDEKEEYVIISQTVHQAEVNLLLTQLNTMTAMTKNSHFSEVIF